jgi:hypothetical protein
MTDPRLWDRRGRRRGEQLMVPRAEFSSYYGRPVVKPPVWQERDIAGYLFTGGIAAGSAVVALGGQLTDRPALRRNGRLSALAFLGISGAALVHDLGVPARFHHMLRVVKPTSPMSVGTWLLSAFGLPVGVAAVAELSGVVPPPLRPLAARAGGVAGVAAAVVAPGIATYTAVLVSDTAVPAWNAARAELPFVFAGSALSGSAGLAMLLAPCAENAPAVRLAVLGAALELAASQRIEHRSGLELEPYGTGRPGRMMRGAKWLTGAAAVGAALFARRSRTAAALCGATLLGASALTRFAIFEAGVASTRDPAYTVVPQRNRLREHLRG